MSDRKTLTEGFTSDGYIQNQDCFHEVRYRTMPAHINGCGWIAAYNLRHFLGHTVGWDEVRREMDAMHTLPIPGPTLMRVMREYLTRYASGYLETSGREKALAAAENASAGIFRYQEEGVPHFVFFYRMSPVSGSPETDSLQPEPSFRFLNVNDLQEDIVLPMRLFGERHFVRGNVIAITL